MPTLNDINKLAPFFYRRPSDPYLQDMRPMGKSDIANGVADFEDSQAHPYTFPSGPFSTSLTTGVTASSNGTFARHVLAWAQNGGASASYIQWTSSVAKTIRMIFVHHNYATAATSASMDCRWWGVQSPGASDNYYGVRWQTTTAGLSLAFVYGTGINLADSPTVITPYTPAPIGRFIAIDFDATSGPTGLASMYDAASRHLIAGLSASGITGWPTSMKTWRFWLRGGTQANVRIDYLWAY